MSSCLSFPLLASLFIITTWFSIITLFAVSVVALILLNLALKARGVAMNMEQKTDAAQKILYEYKFPNTVLEEMSNVVSLSLAQARQNQTVARNRN
ncbi:hypothetical protein Mgra_00006605 [Meloidogyne graminicola]|uniref:Uncharacterized protein n=1 Tax=Meloidogyne graminicola TaxID=189291 RepID=A0A8S9ZKQ7_9BILA|nr:hypothetical protein Mgra_00006605 [Meloidogyne graminicola]